MHKNHLSQNRPSPQNQASSMPSTYAYILDENGGSSSQPATMSLNEAEDDDDICPVCESECTCANRTRNTFTLPMHNYPNGYIIQDASKKMSGNAPPNKQPSSLKIKLTLPPRPHGSSSSTNSKPSSGRSLLSKQKSRFVVQTTNAGGRSGGDALCDSLSSTTAESLASGSAHDVQSNADHSIPKKRGRPTKAVIAAREAAKHASEARQPDEVTGQSIGNVVVARRSKPAISRRAAKVDSSSAAKKKGKKLHGAAAASQAKARQRRAQGKLQDGKAKRQTTVDDDESSELSELDDDDDHPFGLPTFVPALSSSSNSSSSDSGSDTDSDCDKGIPPYPLPQHTSSLLLADNEYAQRKREYHNTWDIRVRKRSVGADGDTDAGMDTDSGEEEEEEEEGDDEADENDEDADGDDTSVRQLASYSGIATGWTDDEESSFDADLFFANLSDSSGEGSGDEQMAEGDLIFSDDNVQSGVSNTTGFDVMRLSEVAAAGFLAPFADLDRHAAENLPFGQGWDHLSLSSGFRDSLMDLDIESSRRLPLGSLLDPPIPGYEEAEAMMATSEEEEAVAMFENCSQTLDEEDVVEIFEDSDGGETTEDEFVDVDGVATPRREVLLRFPASLVAIDPMSTVSSPVKGPIDRERSLSLGSRPRNPSRAPPKPTDFFSGKAFLRDSQGSSETFPIDQCSKQAIFTPAMGCFTPQASDKTKHAVIARSDSSPKKVIPCPYPAIRRLRGRGTSVSVLSRSGSDLSRRSRTPSLLASARSPFDTFTSGDFDSPDDAQLPPGEPIRLDDVIDTKFLEPDRSDATMPESTTSETGEVVETCGSDSECDPHLKNLRRWDQIPILAFRKTRALGATNDLMDEMDVVIGTPRAPRPSDGFSYGSAAGGMLRGSPLSATLWEPSTQAEHKAVTSAGSRRGKLSSLLVSPVLLPVRDGDRTPTAERQEQRQQQHYSGFAGQHAAFTQQNIKSRKELRKEKKRNRKIFSSATSQIRHNHFPNAKSRATSSMQRMPSLSL